MNEQNTVARHRAARNRTEKSLETANAPNTFNQPCHSILEQFGCSRGSIRFAAAIFVLCCLSFNTLSSATAKESTEDSIAAYADAANFQTNGAFDLAIEAWQNFLKEHPKDDLASKAAHYLGVCYMQKESPDYVAAAQSFDKALADSKFDLREESLANQGWCWYASAGDGPNRNQERLRSTIATYAKLKSEKPQSQFLDRALFYSGEAAYGLGERKQAIDFYNRRSTPFVWHTSASRLSLPRCKPLCLIENRDATIESRIPTQESGILAK